MEFHGVKTSVVTKCSGTADILPVPFAESRSAWLARCAGTRSVARGGGLHFLNFDPWIRKEPALWGSVYRGSALGGEPRGRAPAGHVRKGADAQRVDNNSEQNNKRHKLSRVIHSGAVNDRTQHGIPATSEAPGVTVVLRRYIRDAIPRFTQQRRESRHTDRCSPSASRDTVWHVTHVV